MALQSLGLGTTAGDGTGDSIRDGGDKINDNFSEIYTLLGTGTALSSGISATATVVTLAAPSITGAASFADGSVSAPAITNIGDSNTGIFFSAADTVSVTTGGTKRVDIDSSGITVTGALAVSSTSAFSGNASHADNVKALFGTGNDLEIYHDGSNSLIDDTGTGSLFLRSGLITLSGAGGGETMATFTDDSNQINKEFASISQLFKKVKTKELNTLSIGMSGDYKLAINNGSTMVRIGSAIFGHRN